MKQKKKMSLLAKQSVAGWVFLTPATILIAIMAFWPMIQAFIMSLQTGSSANMHWNEPLFNNYTRMFSDKVFLTSVGNTFLYLIIQVPIMLILAILLAQLLNNQHLKFKGFFRTCVFLPCATALVSYSIIFIIVLIILFSLRLMGAGDIKLYAFVVFMYPGSLSLNIIIISMLTAGVISAAKLIKRHLISGHSVNGTVPLAIFIFIASLIAVITKGELIWRG